MGNSNSSKKHNFFTILKKTTSYGEFLIKMNQLICRESVRWTFDPLTLSDGEISLHLDLIENFYLCSTEYIFEHSV